MYNLFLFSYLEFILGVRKQEGKQLIVGDYDVCHTTVQLFNTSLYFSLNMRMCKTRFVIKQWKGIGIFNSVSKRWGLIGAMSLILAWQKDYQHCTSLGWVSQGVLWCLCCSSALCSVVVWVFEVAGWGPVVHCSESSSVCWLMKEWLSQCKCGASSQALDSLLCYWWAVRKSVGNAEERVS